VARNPNGNDSNASLYFEVLIRPNFQYRFTFRLDEEQAIRLAEKDSLNGVKFKLEVHVYFDDAWTDDKECGRVPNEYFKMLFEVLMELTRY
jgi:hypothetical protein